MTDQQSLARDLLSIYDRLTYLPTYNHADLATELRAALDRETALRAEVERLKGPPVAWRYWKEKFMCWEYSDVFLTFPAVPAGTKMEPLILADKGWGAAIGAAPSVACQNCGLERTILMSGASCKSVDCPQIPMSAFTGRITGRNRADIPSDAGVPPREQWAGYGEGWSVGAWPDEQRIDTIAANGPTGLHYPDAMCNDPEGRITEDDAVSRAIGQQGTKA